VRVRLNTCAKSLIGPPVKGTPPSPAPQPSYPKQACFQEQAGKIAMISRLAVHDTVIGCVMKGLDRVREAHPPAAPEATGPGGARTGTSLPVISWFFVVWGFWVGVGSVFAYHPVINSPSMAAGKHAGPAMPQHIAPCVPDRRAVFWGPFDDKESLRLIDRRPITVSEQRIHRHACPSPRPFHLRC